MIKLTRPLIDKFRTNGTFTRASLSAIGVDGFSGFQKGWVDRLLVGKEVSEESYQAAINGVGVKKNQFKKLEKQKLRDSMEPKLMMNDQGEDVSDYFNRRLGDSLFCVNECIEAMKKLGQADLKHFELLKASSTLIGLARDMKEAHEHRDTRGDC